MPSLLEPTRVVVDSFATPAAGARQLYLALNLQDLQPLNASFDYYEQPDNITSIAPTGGPTRGGTAVTIRGGPFDVFSSDPRDMLCRFGVGHTHALHVTPHEIVCRTPPADGAAAATVPVALSLNGAETDFGEVGHDFKFYTQPAARGSDEATAASAVEHVTPVGGPLEGGTRTTIVGRGFMAFAPVISFVRCRWDGGIVDPLAAALGGVHAGMPAPESIAVEHTDTRIVCVVPPAQPGADPIVNISLALNAHDFGETALTFKYYAAPQVDTITPSGGHRTGGTAVTLSGSGFDVLEGGAHVSCQYGSPLNAAYNERYTITLPLSVSATSIVCLAPSTKV